MDRINAFTSVVRKGVDDYRMISDGDRVAVGISGGKDSLVLLCALAQLRRFSESITSKLKAKLAKPSDWKITIDELDKPEDEDEEGDF